MGAQTINAWKVFGRYQQEVWRDEDGLPQSSATAIIRTRDGYLWMGTEEGLARFDGVRFTVFDRNNNPQMGSSNVSALLEDRTGNLWIGTFGGGVTRLTGGHFTNYATKEGLSNNFALCLMEDRVGNIWVGTDGGGLNRFRDGRFTSYTTRDGLPDNHVWALSEDGDGGLWIGTANGLARLKDGAFTVFTTRDGLPHNYVRALVYGHGGNLWVGTNGGGLCRFKDGDFTAYGAREGFPDDRVFTLLEDREGSLWIGTFYGGLYRYEDGHFSAYTARDGLPTNFVRTLYQDPEGDLWVSMDTGGVAQLRDGRFRVYTTADGLFHDYARAVYGDSLGNVWVGTLQGVNQIKPGKITVFTEKDGLPPDPVLAIGQDRAGNIWVGTYGGGLRQLAGGRFVAYTTKEGLSNDQVYSLLGDHAGNLWTGTRSGLNLFRDGRFRIYTTRDGMADDFTQALFEDRAGGIWIGSRRGGMSLFKDGKFTNWTTKDGLGSNWVLSFYEDREGTLWIGTQGGLSRLKDGKLATITDHDGLYDNIAFQILEDDAGDLWMSCNKGIYRVRRQELNDFADGRITAVTSVSYGVADGTLSRECTLASPGGWKTRDGRLWFPTTKGVVVIDPQRRNREPPRVNIEAVKLDRAPLPASQPVRIRPGQERLEIDYTALSWKRPKESRFKYQLAGLDHDWVEAGTRRTAYYSHLPPGDYTFRVIADNGEGVWNTDGKRLSVVVLPPFWRTSWFIALCALAIAGTALGVFRLRLQQLRDRQLAQENFSRRLIEAHEDERRHLAAELHDGLGQSLAMIKNSAVYGTQSSGNSELAKTQLEQITKQSGHAISEMRAIAHNLRPYLLDRLGLTKALNSLLNEVAATSALKVNAKIDNIDGLFPPPAEMSIYRIVQESVNNILKHAGATKIDVALERNKQGVHLEIRDNGKGFDLPNVINSERRGFGLLGIAERVRLLGGTHSIVSLPAHGTVVRVELPARG